MWERACSRSGCHSQHPWRLSHRHPQVDPRRAHILRALKITVGASLLAKRSSQSTSLAPDPPPSRASSLPQVDPRRPPRHKPVRPGLFNAD
ncbi:hypothetical protein C1X64_23320 [Pseudomonas sp. GW456-E7]|nr:hypothetical protein C1X64_23320 [Pseudomonas sp. GW456-E7]